MKYVREFVKEFELRLLTKQSLMVEWVLQEQFEVELKLKKQRVYPPKVLLDWEEEASKDSQTRILCTFFFCFFCVLFFPDHWKMPLS